MLTVQMKYDYLAEESHIKVILMEPWRLKNLARVRIQRRTLLAGKQDSSGRAITNIAGPSE
jgi:hypothetical protein